MHAASQPHTLPHAAFLASMSIQELMDATLRLSDVLATESELIEQMRYKELPALHEEKTKLSALLENYQQVMMVDPSFVQNADARAREELLLLTDDLAFNIQDNFRKVSAAKAVNGRVLQAIMDVMNEDHRPVTYGRNGYASQTSDRAISLNLNQKA